MERALEALRDPALEGSPAAGELRGKVVDRLCARAALRAGEGRDASVLRLLSIVESEDEARARDWRERLLKPAEPRDEEALSKLLADMRAAESQRKPKPEPGPGSRFTVRVARPLGSSASPVAPGSRGSSAPSARPFAASKNGSSLRGERADDTNPLAEPGVDPAQGLRPLRFQMAVDDGGEFLVVSGERVSVGHSSQGAADIPVLADLESVHATFVFAESFHSGPCWQIEPVAQAGVAVNGTAVEGAQVLCDGDLVDLTPRLSFRFRLPEAASASALLELLGGVEAEGAVRVLLFARGPAGRVRIGAQRSRHLPVAGLEYDVQMTLSEGGLNVTCEGGVRFNTATTESDAAVACTIPLPLSGRVEVIANARPSRRPPFGIALHALDAG